MGVCRGLGLPVYMYISIIIQDDDDDDDGRKNHEYSCLGRCVVVKIVYEPQAWWDTSLAFFR